jgi:hypothetical protein
LAHKLIWGADLYKGFKLDKNSMLGGNVQDILPFQMLTQEEKTIDWIKAVADFYDIAGWNNVEKKAGRIQKNYDMRTGKLNPSDYIVNPQINPFHQAVQWTMPQEHQSPLEQFYPLLGPFVDVLRGEFVKRDNRWSVEVVDQFSHSEMFKEKRAKFEQVLMQQAVVEKQMALAQMGITEETDQEQYQQQLQSTVQQLQQIEFESKSFRTTGAKWAEKVLQIHDKRYHLAEIEPDGFECGLITDREYWHLDLMEDDFALELLNPKWVDKHKGPNVKYVSQGDYFLWFDFMSSGDIINKYGRKMKEEDMLKLKDIFVKVSSALIIPDYLKQHPGIYYDLTKPYNQATDLNPVVNDMIVGQELAHSYMRSPNFDHNLSMDIFNPTFGRTVTGHPQMFRVMRLYWRSLRRIGWLTKINRDGSRDLPDWVDENYKVTIEPVYDKSVTKEETKDNLLYGEHIDWTWAPEWRHVMKISPNSKHSFWLSTQNNFEAIYIDGGPVQFQFKGRENPFDSLPPVEGCEFSYINSDPHSFIDRGKGLQIIYNIAMNKVPRQFLDDNGLKVAVDRRTFPMNNLNTSTPGIDPRDEYEDRLKTSSILEYSMDREAMAGMGQAALPTVLNLSTAQLAEFWLNVADRIKWQAAENIGITRARMGGQKASETAFGIQQGINYSETQTEKYFEQHANLMQRVRQRMIDAAQYYTTFKQSSREIYQNEMAENVWVEVEGMDNLLPHYNVNLESRANTRANLKIISDYLQADAGTLPIKPSAKLQAMIEGSVPKILTLIKEGEMQQEQMEMARMQQEQQLQAQQLQAQEKLNSDKLQTQILMQDKELQNNIDVANINAEDNSPLQTGDPSKDLANQLKQKELGDKNLANQQKINADAQKDLNKNLSDRLKSQAEIDKAKIQGEYALKVAKENKSAAELKKKNTPKK